jgi:phage terminase Nu1 subunit (DNA packaging protein)
MQPIICPQKEAAEWLGITARRLRQLQQAGHLPGFDRGAVDLKATVQAYCRHMAEVAAGRRAGLPELAGGLPLRGGPSSSADIPPAVARMFPAAAASLDLMAERARLAREPWVAQEMKNQTARRLLLPRDEVTAAVQACFSRVRARLLAIPTRAAPQVLLLGGMAEVKALLTALVHEALQELSETKVVALAEGATPVAADDDAGDGDLPDDNE